MGYTMLSVSVIIPTYNRASLITRAVSSVLASVEAGDEVFVIDDGSTDGTEAVLEPFRERIRYIRTKNQGAGPARNRGIQEAKNPLIAFLDSDDEWLPQHLVLHRAVHAAHDDIVFSFSDFYLMDEMGRIHRNYLAHWHNDPRRWSEILGIGKRFNLLSPLLEGKDDCELHIGNLYPSFFKAGYVPTFTTVVRKEALKGGIVFPSDLPLYEDWEFFGRLTSQGPVAYLDSETVINHAHSFDRLTKSELLDVASSRIKVLERVWGNNSDFLVEYGEEYRKLLHEQHLLRIRGLLKNMFVSEAREEIGQLNDVPFSYWIAKNLPNSLVRFLIRLNASFKRDR